MVLREVMVKYRVRQSTEQHSLPEVLILPVGGSVNNSFTVVICRHFHGKCLCRRPPNLYYD
jgi:hypothetical protein